jgi:putative RecB family exonuclease
MTKQQTQRKRIRDTYSPYSIGLYVKCPRQYYFEYLDNYTSVYPHKKQLKQIQVEAGKRRELIFGELLHIVLNVLLHQPEAERNEKKLISLLKENWAGPRGKKGGFPNLEEEREWYREAIAILKGFAQSQSLAPDIAYLPEVEKEGEFVDANFLKVPLQPDVILAGKIDRMDKEGDTCHLIDYKTGKGERDDEFQLMAYSILATEALGLPPTKASYLYLRSGNVKSFEPDKEAIARTKTKVLEIAEKIRSEKEFLPRPTKMCYYCNYLEFCPAKEKAKELIAEYKGEDEVAELPF